MTQPGCGHHRHAARHDTTAATTAMSCDHRDTTAPPSKQSGLFQGSLYRSHHITSTFFHSFRGHIQYLSGLSISTVRQKYHLPLTCFSLFLCSRRFPSPLLNIVHLSSFFVMKNTFNMLAIAMLISTVVTLVRADSSQSHTVNVKSSCQGTQLNMIINKAPYGTTNGVGGFTSGQAIGGSAWIDNGGKVNFTLANPSSWVHVPEDFTTPIKIQYISACDKTLSCPSTECNGDLGPVLTCPESDASVDITFCP